MKQIVIIGAGCAGVMAANRTRRVFGQDEAKITIIERNDRHLYQPGLMMLLFDLDKPENLIRPTKDLLLKGINLIIDEAISIKPEQNRVITAKHGDISYDYLVITTGAKLYFDEPEGMKEGLEKGENVFTFYTMEGAIRLREALRKFEGGTIVSSIAEMPIKCPGAPVKFIMFAESAMRKRGIRNKCKFVFTTPTLSVPPIVEPYTSALNAILKSRGIGVMFNFIPAKVKNGILEDFMGNQIEFDLLCITPPHLGENLIQNSKNIGDPLGWVLCDKNSLIHKNFSNIYAIGDANNLPSGKTGSAARIQAKVLTHQLRARIQNKTTKITYDGTTICPIITEYGKAMFAKFNYVKSISSARESYINWLIDIYLLRQLYWGFMLKGLF